jgi:hypothetical protein
MATEGRRLSRLLDDGLAFLKEKIYLAAETERDYRKAKSEAWLRCPLEDETGKWTAARREAWVDAQTADLRYARDVADGLVRTGHQAVKSRQYQISLLQSTLNAFKSEADFARTGPEWAA